MKIKFNYLIKIFCATIICFGTNKSVNAQVYLTTKKSAEDLLQNLHVDLPKELKNGLDIKHGFFESDIPQTIGIDDAAEFQKEICNGFILGGLDRKRALARFWNWITFRGWEYNTQIVRPVSSGANVLDTLINKYKFNFPLIGNELGIEDAVQLSIKTQLINSFSLELKANNIPHIDSLSEKFNDTLTSYFKSNSISKIECVFISDIGNPQEFMQKINQLNQSFPENNNIKQNISSDKPIICGMNGLLFKHYESNTSINLDMRKFVSNVFAVSASATPPNIVSSISSSVNSQWEKEISKIQNTLIKYKILKPTFVPFYVKVANKHDFPNNIMGDTNKGKGLDYYNTIDYSGIWLLVGGVILVIIIIVYLKRR